MIMFMPQFALRVLDGSKRQTMRCRARCAAGDTLSLRCWLGKPYRSKQRVLAEHVCTTVQRVRVTATGVEVGPYRAPFTCVPDAFARADGFGSFMEMLAWLEARGRTLPWEGEVIYW